MSEIDAIRLEDRLPKPAEPPAHMARVGTSRIPTGYKFWYDKVIDVMLERPDLPLYKVAELLGRKSNWIYLLAKSDSFREHYEYRRKEHNDRLTTGIVERAGRVAAEALDILLERLEKNPESVKPKEALDVAQVMMTKLGMGNQPNAPSVVVQPTVVVASASPDELVRARELIKAAEAARLAQSKTLELTAEGGDRSVRLNAPSTK